MNLMASNMSLQRPELYRRSLVDQGCRPWSSSPQKVALLKQRCSLWTPTKHQLHKWTVSVTRQRTCSCARPTIIFPDPTSRSISTPDPSSRKACRLPQVSRCAITISTYKARHRRRFTCCTARAKTNQCQANSTLSTHARSTHQVREATE